MNDAAKARETGSDADDPQSSDSPVEPIETDQDTADEAPEEAPVEASEKAGEEASKTPVEILAEAHQENLMSAFTKAQQMMAFSVEQGIELDPAIVAPVNNAIRTFCNGRWSAETEDQFFAAYSKLSARLGDVSSETIEWSKENGSRTTLWMAIFGGLMLLLLIIIQYRVIYLYDSSTNYQQTRDLLSAQSTELATVKIKLSALYNNPEGELTKEEFRAQEAALTTQEAALNEHITRLKNRLQAQYTILSEWVSAIDDGPAPKEPGWFASDEEVAAYETALAEWRSTQDKLEPHEQEYGIQQAVSQLRLLNDYILPAIYGALGTIAFILRQISIRLQAQSLRLSTIMNYLVRLPLGALSGIAVGLLLRPEDTPEGIAALQPLALAFVAGYSVELVFAAMDRLVIAFTGDKQRT